MNAVPQFACRGRARCTETWAEINPVPARRRLWMSLTSTRYMHLNPPHNGAKPSSRFSTLNVFKLKPLPLSAHAPSDRPPDAPPPPPPKDPGLNPPRSAFYNKAFFSRSATSLAPSLSPESLSPASPMPSEFGKRQHNGRAAAASPAPSASGRSLGDCLASPSMEGSTDSSGSCPNTNGMYLLHGASSSSYAMGQATKPKKGVFRLAGLAKRNRSRKDLSDTASASVSVSGSTSVSEQESPSGNPEGDQGITLPWNFQVGMSSARDHHSGSPCIA
jgi:hypothetical protein